MNADQLQTLVHIFDERNLPPLLLNAAGGEMALHNVNEVTQPLTDRIVQRACTLYRTHVKEMRKIGQQSATRRSVLNPPPRRAIKP